jgi:hypothetical protein
MYTKDNLKVTKQDDPILADQLAAQKTVNQSNEQLKHLEENKNKQFACQEIKTLKGFYSDLILQGVDRIGVHLSNAATTAKEIKTAKTKRYINDLPVIDPVFLSPISNIG